MPPYHPDDPSATIPFLEAEQRSGPDDGVDVTLIRWMLDLEPAERLAALQGAVRSILTLRDQGRS